jgi:two-component sensor histidine kinase
MRNLDSPVPSNVEPLAANDFRGAESANVIVAESNHRIANNLSVIASLLRQQSRALAQATRAFTGEEVALILEQVGQRVDTVARFHRLLAQPTPDSTVDAGEYLHEVARAAIASMALAGEVRLEPPESDRCALHSSQAMLVGLIVGELVMNSVKYAHPAHVRGTIRLNCAVVGEWTWITVADDGVGFPDGFDPERSGGLGLRMSRLLTQQLRGALSYESSPLGLTTRLFVPLISGDTVVAFTQPAG